MTIDLERDSVKKIDYELFKMFATIGGISIFLTTITALVVLKYFDYTHFYKDEANAMIDSYIACIKANPKDEAGCRDRAIKPFLFEDRRF